ncbi:hypothetical protein QFW77_18275 [Luteimonas sp. RD2P54]|uniref:Uncharacterized protein n=1 Tax=Luteimonas endophytica TaxID=3042023 RepID=A0ABT6JDQ2_9GAMM|nr:hypothetical protein [Luteimonas endophytica]MDH5824916.1 hypothetical protein [Luteimonas endophytica]
MTPSLSGTPAQWLRANDNLLVRFGLNVADADARRRNEGASIEMLTDAHLNLAPDRLFRNVVAVSRGAALSIQIRSRAQVGFGFRIATDAGPIVDRLYAVDRPDAEGHRTATVRRFQHQNHLITVDRMRDRLGDSHDLGALQRLWGCDIHAWAVLQYLDPIAGRVFNADHPRFPPAPAAAAARSLRSGAMPAAAAVTAAGERSLGVNAGVVWADGAAEQQFERIDVQDEDGPEDPIGRLRLHFFVVDAD